jgi:hypothetical protein
VNYYSTNAEQLAEQYNRLDPAQVHGHWLQHLAPTEISEVRVKIENE